VYHHNNAALRRGSLPLGTREVVKLIAVAPDGSSVSIVISSLESVRNVPVSSLAEQSLQKAEDAARGFTFGHIFERTAAPLNPREGSIIARCVKLELHGTCRFVSSC